MNDHEGQVVIITGASGALGMVAAKIFSESGAILILPDRETGRIAALLPEVHQNTTNLIADSVDIGNPPEFALLVEKVGARYGRVDVLVHTAGGYQAGKIPHLTSIETWDAMQDLNARLTFITNRAVAPVMAGAGSGAIINIAAKPALKAGSQDIAYSASKAAVARITESIAAAYGGKGVRANALIPSIFDTPGNRASMPNADFSKWTKPEEIVRVIQFLASADGRIINGALIPLS